MRTLIFIWLPTDFQRFYNSEETSDVVLLLPGVPMGRIHAHKVILSAASDDFKMELLQPELLVSDNACFVVLPSSLTEYRKRRLQQCYSRR